AMDPSTLSNPGTLLTSLQTSKLTNGTSDSPTSSTTSSAPTKMKSASNNNSSSNGNAGGSSAAPAAPVAPRLDSQPFYDALKLALTKEQWTTYTITMNYYLSGQYSEGEFQEKIGGFIVGEKRRLHNAIIA